VIKDGPAHSMIRSICPRATVDRALAIARDRAENSLATPFATQLIGTEYDALIRATVLQLKKTNRITLLGTRWHGVLQIKPSCKTVYTSSILVVASSNKINDLARFLGYPDLLISFLQGPLGTRPFPDHSEFAGGDYDRKFAREFSVHSLLRVRGK
jgi:hypothetical protein